MIRKLYKVKLYKRKASQNLVASSKSIMQCTSLNSIYTHTHIYIYNS